MKITILRLGAVASLFVVAALTLAEDLTVGSVAPPIKVAKWVKGAPIKSFEKGKVYVVEFWATWCGPCKTSIPHLTELAHKYKNKVTFTGVSVFETQDPKDTSYQAKVASFVKDMGDKMDYSVCYDGPEGTMAKTWMEAAKQDGIPTAFIVDQNGKVAWIGHPMAELDQVLDQVLEGKYDGAAAAKKKADQQAAMEKLQNDMAEIEGMMENGKNAEAVARLDKIIAANPTMKPMLSGLKFELLIKVGDAKAYDVARELASGEYKNNAAMLNQLAWTIIDPENPVKNADYKCALEIAIKAGEASKFNDAMILDTLALAYFKNDNLDKAIEYQEKAVKLLGSDIDPQTKKEIEDRLKMYKEKKGGGN